jgi:hypothetical protein
MEVKEMLFSPQSTADCDRQSETLIPHSSWLLLAVLGAILLGSGCSRSQGPGQDSVGSRAKTEVAPPFSAEMWLKWDKSSRLAFIMGNLRGYWDGVEAGCFDAKREVGSLPGVSGFTPEVADEMWLHCGTKYKPSNRTFESYEEVITSFYSRYPEDRVTEIQDVLLLLAGDPELTAEDIHKRIKITQNPKR